jgi:ankyrin repeat protein
VELLLTRGADINEQDGNGQTALMEACGAGTPRGVNNALLLLGKGADANIKDSEGKKAANYLPESKPDEAGDGEWKALVDRLAGK